MEEKEFLLRLFLFEAQREFKYSQLLFSMGVNCHGRHSLLFFLHSWQNLQISLKLVL